MHHSEKKARDINFKEQKGTSYEQKTSLLADDDLVSRCRCMCAGRARPLYAAAPNDFDGPKPPDLGPLFA